MVNAIGTQIGQSRGIILMLTHQKLGFLSLEKLFYFLIFPFRFFSH